MPAPLRGVSLTPDQWQVVYGSILGDGSLGKPKNGLNYHLTIAHSERQLNYLRWKAALLAPLVSEPKEYRRLDPRFSRVYSTWRIQSKTLEAFTLLAQECYPAGKKRLPMSLLERCGPLAVAVWFMDDGGQDGGVARFATVCFPRSDVEAACEWFGAQWGITAHPTPDNRIVVTGPSRDRLREILLPHIPACMAYKIPIAWDAARAISGRFRPDPAFEHARRCVICDQPFCARDRRQRACGRACVAALAWRVRRGELPKTVRTLGLGKGHRY